MHKTFIALAAALMLGLSGGAFAQPSPGASPSTSSSSGASSTPASGGASSTSPAGTDTKAMKKQADADYKAAKAHCKPLKGDEQKACQKDAKSAHDKALADVKRAQADAKAAKKTPKTSS